MPARMEKEKIEKIKAVTLGHAVADAIGVPVEFKKRDELGRYPVTDMMGGGTYGMPEGCWSDDTSMALCMLDSLSFGCVDYDDVMERFVRWMHDGEYTPTGVTFDIGGTCREAISNFLDGKRALDSGLCCVDSNGNGSLMRIYPAVIYLWLTEQDIISSIEDIYNASRITHAHPRSLVGCGIYTFVLYELLTCGGIESVERGLRLAYDFYRENKEIGVYKRLFDPDFTKSPIDEIFSTGYVVDTLLAARWCVLTTKDYKSCVLKAVNLGDDTDTVAAVAGSLAGALYGLSSIPREWRSRLKKREYIEGVCKRAYIGITCSVFRTV